MITLFLFFLLLSIFEAIIIWFKWNEISDFVSLGKLASKAAGIEEKYTGIINQIAIWFIKRKDFIWIPIGILLFANLIVATAIVFFVWVIELVSTLF